jgi:hypothetical protein
MAMTLVGQEPGARGRSATQRRLRPSVLAGIGNAFVEPGKSRDIFIDPLTSRNRRPLSTTELANVIRHELSHFNGLEDSSAKGTMNANDLSELLDALNQRDIELK